MRLLLLTHTVQFRALSSASKEEIMSDAVNENYLRLGLEVCAAMHEMALSILDVSLFKQQDYSGSLLSLPIRSFPLRLA